MKILPYFINHAGCPHQCVFCNQRVINGYEQAPLAEFEAFLTKYTRPQSEGATARHRNGAIARHRNGAIARHRNGAIARHCDGATAPQLAFYGGSFTALPQDLMTSYLELAEGAWQRGHIASVRISTRPDAIDDEILEILKVKHVVAIELGVQSLDDAVLCSSLRGHSSESVGVASSKILSWGFELGHQLMLGLPGQSVESFRQSVIESIAMKPHTVRLYPVQVLKGTQLAQDYLGGQYSPMPLDLALAETAWAVQKFRKAGIRVIKIGLQAHEALMDPDVRLAGPYHPAYGEWVEGLIVQARLQWGLEHLLQRGKCVRPPGEVRVYCHPRGISQVSGLSKGNKEWLETQWHMTMTIVPNAGLKLGELLLEVGSVLLALPNDIL